MAQVFQLILLNFSEQFSYKTPPDDCFWSDPQGTNLLFKIDDILRSTKYYFMEPKMKNTLPHYGVIILSMDMLIIHSVDNLSSVNLFTQ